MATKSKSIYSRICALLKVGDEGKVQSLLNMVVRELKRSIVGNEQSIKNCQYELETLLTKHQDRVEDLTQAVTDAEESVDLTRIQTNADREVYMRTYLQNISNAEKALEDVEKQYENNKKAFTDEIERLEAQNVKLADRISRILGE
jgi:hypothetical protein